MAKIKFTDLGLDPNVHTVEQLKKQLGKLNKLPPDSGLMNTPKATKVFGYQTPTGIAGINVQDTQAAIVVGSVPPMGLSSGLGGMGAPAGTIDLVVGRNAAAKKGKGPDKDSVVDNNFVTDAARIYISRLTNLDQYFNLDSRPGPKQGPGLKNRSGIGIKADGVRIIGREGVRIVTGKASGAKVGMFGETNSIGGRIESAAPKIEFVAGNNYEGVSGIARGDATRDALRELHDIVQDIWGAIFNFAVLQTSWDGVLGVTPLPHHAAGAAPKSMGNMDLVMSSLYSSRINLILWHFNSLLPAGDSYIVSRNVRSN
jgi:hypothetical protein